jgi:hypothetical protein
MREFSSFRNLGGAASDREGHQDAIVDVSVGAKACRFSLNSKLYQTSREKEHCTGHSSLDAAALLPQPQACPWSIIDFSSAATCVVCASVAPLIPRARRIPLLPARMAHYRIFEWP